MTNIKAQPIQGLETNQELVLNEGTSRLEGLYRAAKLSGQWAVVMAEISPLNEVARGGLFVAGEVVSRNPFVGGLTIGLSTFAIEACGGLAAAELMNSSRGQRLFGEINKKSSSLHVPMIDKRVNIPMEISGLSKVGWTLLGGTVVGMAIEQRENPLRSVRDNKAYSLMTSIWLGGVAGVGGILLSEGVDIGLNDPKTGGFLTASVVGAVAAGKWLKKKFIHKREIDETAVIIDIDPNTNLRFQFTKDRTRLQKASKLEQDIWFEKGYGSLDEYEQYIKHSRTFTALDGENCIGVARLFGGRTIPPPFVELPFDSITEHSVILEECSKGNIEEVGTVAVAKEHRNGLTSTHLYRLAYRDARSRGIQKWGIIMEPERVQAMNEMYGFTFKQLGKPIEYQGGACAAHIMDLDEVDANMSQKFPEIYEWFVSRPLST